MRLYAVQEQVVLDTVDREGISYVKSAYIDRKYGDSAWIFKLAYSALMKQMEKALPRPSEADSPIWLYGQPSGAFLGSGYLLTLDVPESEVVLFDSRNWNKMLNLRPLDDNLDQRLMREGVDVVQVFRSSFYPLYRQQIAKSWEQILSRPLPENPHYLQGAVWCLKREWVIGREQL